MASPRSLLLASLVALSLVSSGCYTVRNTKVASAVHVSTVPAGAWVWTEDDRGKAMKGRAPLEVQTQTTVRTYQPRRALLWTAVVAGVAASVVGGVLLGNEMDMGSDSPSIGAVLGGTTLLTVGVPLAIAALAGAIMGESQAGKRLGGAPVVKIGASLSGHRDAWELISLPFPGKKMELRLTPAAAGTATKPTPTRRGRAIVAVFGIKNDTTILNALSVGKLYQYLTVQVAATAQMRVVPQDRLRKELSTQKKASYKDCFAQACQIDLGRALAADRSLATKIIQVGRTCAVTSVLYDLKTETSIAAASADTDCSLDGLMAGIRKVARTFAGRTP